MVKNINARFSPTTAEVLADARRIAISLGYDYISTIHFFLADCAITRPGSIRDFRFKNLQQYQAFFAAMRLDTPFHTTEASLSLTLEAETTIKRAFDELRLYPTKTLEPYHLMLAALKYPDSLLQAAFGDMPAAAEQLLLYYQCCGVIARDTEPVAGRTSLLHRLLRTLHLS